jgi:TDG/mug DNA glycosylase family protein
VAAPRVACFVGKGIWDTFAGVVTRAIKDKEAVPRRDPAAAAPATPGRVVQYTLQGGQATPTRTAKAEPDAEPNAEPASPLVKAEPDTASPAARNGRGKAKPKAKGRAKPEPVVYDAPQRLRLRATSREGFVYLWVVPNTSGLERTPLAQQVEYFSALRAFADSLARGEEPQGAFVDVDIEQVEAFGQTLESR